MKVKLDTHIQDPNGSAEIINGKPLLTGEIICNAINCVDPNATYDQMVERGNLILEIKEKPDFDFTLQQLNIIKSGLGLMIKKEIISPSYLLQIHSLIDPKPNK